MANNPNTHPEWPPGHAMPPLPASGHGPRRRLSASWWTLAAGLALTTLVCFQSEKALQHRDDQRFNELTSHAAEQIRERANQYPFGLLAARTAFVASRHVDDREFLRLAQAMDLHNRFPGAQGIGHASWQTDQPHVPASSAELAQTLVAKHHLSDGGQFLPMPMDADSPLIEAAIQATNTQQATLSRVLHADGSTDRTPLLCLPIYDTGQPLKTTEQRWAACTGWVFMPIDLQQAFEGLNQLQTDEMTIHLFDGKQTNNHCLAFDSAPDKQAHTHAHRHAEGTSNHANDRHLFAPAARTGYSSLHFGGRAWTVTFQTTEGFQTASRLPLYLSGGMGVAVSILTSLLLGTHRRAATKAKRLAQAMTADLRRLAMVAEHSANAVLITDENFQTVWCNKGFVRMTGHWQDQVQDQVLHRFLASPNTESATLARIGQAIAQRKTCRVEMCQRHHDGHDIWADVCIQPFADAATQTRGFILIQSDITQQIHYRNALRESQDFLEATGRAAEVGGWEWHLVNRQMRWTGQTCQLQGLAAGTPPTRQEALSHFDRNSRRQLIKAALWALRTGQPMDIELPLQTAQGHTIWVRIVGHVEQANGKPVCLHGAIQNITESHRAKRKAKEALARLAAYQQAIDHHSIIAVTDAQGRITEVNDLFCEISGYSREELVGQNHRLLNSGTHPKSHWVKLWKTIAKGQCWHGEICNRRKDGSLYWTESSISPIHGIDGIITGYCAVRTDITDLKQIHADLEGARLAADAANQSKSEFLANMSHEIRTPLTAILGYTELLLEPGLTPDTEQASSTPLGLSTLETVQTIHRAGDHLLMIINDILDLSKIEAGKMTIEKIDMPLLDLLADVQQLMQPRAAGKGLALTTHLPTALPERVLSDPTRLRQILMNLVGNAIKFTEHGQVTVEASLQLAQPQTLLSAATQSKNTDAVPPVQAHGHTGDWLEIRVTDSGMGMTAQQSQQLFKPFSQADSSVTRKHGGTGLGLTICRRLAKLMGGRIRLAHTAPGEGSVFVLQLPLIPSQADTPWSDQLPVATQRGPLSTSDHVASQHVTGGNHPWPTSITQAAPANSPLSRTQASTNPTTNPAGPTAPPSPGNQPPANPDAPLQVNLLLVEDGPDNQRLIAHHLKRAGATVTVASNGRQAMDLLGPSMPNPPFDLIVTDLQMPEMDGYSLHQTLRDQSCLLPIVALTAHAMPEDKQRCLDAGFDGYASKPIQKKQLIQTCLDALRQAANRAAA